MEKVLDYINENLDKILDSSYDPAFGDHSIEEMKECVATGVVEVGDDYVATFVHKKHLVDLSDPKDVRKMFAHVSHLDTDVDKEVRFFLTIPKVHIKIDNWEQYVNLETNEMIYVNKLDNKVKRAINAIS